MAVIAVGTLPLAVNRALELYLTLRTQGELRVCPWCGGPEHLHLFGECPEELEAA